MKFEYDSGMVVGIIRLVLKPESYRYILNGFR